MKYINLTKSMKTKVDDEDYALLSKFNWRARQGRSTWYASRRLKEFDWKKDEHMHHVILTPPKGMVVDHINGDGLDNRRENLRICTSRQNSFNAKKKGANGTSSFIGVWKVGSKWRARINPDGKSVHLGYYQTEKEAAEAYNQAAIKHFGKYARLN